MVEESIHVKFDDKLGSQEPKHSENSTGGEIDLTISEVVPEARKHLEDAPKAKQGSENVSEAAAEVNSEVDPLSADLDNLRINVDPSQNRVNRISSANPTEMILGNKEDPIRTRTFLKNSESSLFGFVSLVEPKTVDEALQENDWILAMQEELNQFTRNDVWDLV